MLIEFCLICHTTIVFSWSNQLVKYVKSISKFNLITLTPTIKSMTYYSAIN